MDSKQWLPARCAFEIFPLILLDNPHLYACWEDLFGTLKLAIRDREFRGGAGSAEYAFENVKKVLTRTQATEMPSCVEEQVILSRLKT